MCKFQRLLLSGLYVLKIRFMPVNMLVNLSDSAIALPCDVAMKRPQVHGKGLGFRV